MKLFFRVSIFALLLVFVSCKRCYTCTTNVTIKYNIEDSIGAAFLNGLNQSFSTSEEVCDYKDQIEAFEAENSLTINDQDSFGSFTQTSSTECVKNSY